MIASILIVFHKEIILLIDERYHNAAFVAALVLLCYLFDGYRLVFNNPLAYNVKFVKYKSLILVCSAFLNIGLNLLLIPKYSILS